MQMYQQKSWWKISLAIVGLIIALITMFYANYLARKLAELEDNNVRLWALAIQESVTNESEDLNLAAEFLTTVQSIPVILESEDGKLEGVNFKDENITDQAFLEAEKQKLLNSGFEPIEGAGGYANKIYYKNSRLYTLIKYFPYVQILLLGSFLNSLTISVSSSSLALSFNISIQAMIALIGVPN